MTSASVYIFLSFLPSLFPSHTYSLTHTYLYSQPLIIYQGTIVRAGDPAENAKKWTLLSWNLHLSREVVDTKLKNTDKG